jgi:hypothetical protein
VYWGQVKTNIAKRYLALGVVRQQLTVTSKLIEGAGSRTVSSIDSVLAMRPDTGRDFSLQNKIGF